MFLKVGCTNMLCMCMCILWSEVKQDKYIESGDMWTKKAHQLPEYPMPNQLFAMIMVTLSFGKQNSWGLAETYEGMKSRMNHWARSVIEDTILSSTFITARTIGTSWILCGWSLTNVFRDVLVNWLSRKKAKARLVRFVDFPGLNNPIMTDFKLAIV